MFSLVTKTHPHPNLLLKEKESYPCRDEGPLPFRGRDRVGVV
jgi:hypothetical protein